MSRRSSLSIVTICVLSAAFAACSTSLICIFLLKDNGFFEDCSPIVNKSGPADDFDYPTNPIVRYKDAISRSTTAYTDAKGGGEKKDVTNEKGIDFAIIGWPKTGTSFHYLQWSVIMLQKSKNLFILQLNHCEFFHLGTSFLLKVLGDHPEVVMPKGEFCHPAAGPRLLEEQRVKSLHQLIKQNNELQASSKSKLPKQYGIECPIMIWRMVSIEALMKVSYSTKLIVGLRHPVTWFESYYNYR